DPGSDCDPDGNGILCEPGPWDEVQARCRIYGLAEQATRSVRLFEIAREVFGPRRVVRVLAGQFGSFSSRGGPMLETRLPARGTRVPIAGRREHRFGGPYSRLASDVRSVSAYPGIRIAAYEGGPHFVGRTSALAREVARVNRDPRMKGLYLDFLATWDRMTGG